MSDNPIPRHASIIVIGGGVMGCSTIYHLSKNGVKDAILLERNKLTSGTTWHSAAQVRALRSSKNLTDLISYSINLYSQLERETGQNAGWICKGSLSIATNKDRLIHIKRQEALAKLFGIRAQSISREEAKERWPLMNDQDVLGAVWSPDDGRVSPSDLCAGLIKGAKNKGAKIFEDTAVKGILTKTNKVVGVETDKGSISCDAIAICAGLWSREVGLMTGTKIPIWPCEHFYLLTKPIDGITGNLPTLSDHDNHLYIRDDSGGILVGCFEPKGKAINPERLGSDFSFQLLPEDWDHFEPMMAKALHRVPGLEKAGVKMLLNGPESFTPDGSFLLGETSETKNLFLGCGMNSIGVAIAGGAGMALAHCIQHGSTPKDLHEADPRRFAECFNTIESLTERVPEVLGKHYEISYPGRQWKSSRNLRKLPLHNKFSNLKAHFGQFFGWERSLYFNSSKTPALTFNKPDWHKQVGKEVKNANEGVALFDQSSFGKIEVKGKDACKFLNRLCPNQMDRKIGQVIYTSMLNQKGGIESDLTAIRIREDYYRLYVGTTSVHKDITWLARHINDKEKVELIDRTEDFAVIGLMGPNSSKIANKVGAKELDRVNYFNFIKTNIAGKEVEAVRISYVGEAGWEITCKKEHAEDIFDSLQAAGASPSGLFAQTSMRIEKKFLAYGHDLDSDINPLEAGLGHAIDWNTNFIGKKSLENFLNNKVKNRIVLIKFEDLDAVPLGNEPIYFNNKLVGRTTSASFGYRVGAPLAIAYLNDEEVLNDGQRVSIDIGGNLFHGIVSIKALFDPLGKRMRKM
ncbi:FAD-dependent oxidoreductase [bacterium]|nr:FAD-dependent oxidoreductase [bacterium]